MLFVLLSSLVAVLGLISIAWWSVSTVRNYNGSSLLHERRYRTEVDLDFI